VKHFGLLIGALVLALPAAARAQSQPEPAKGVTLADLVGTWTGGPADSTGAPVAGKDKSMTLTMRPDSTYTWKGISSQTCMAKPNSRWKRLTATNISWCGGPGYNLKLDGNKLVMTSAQGGKRIAFTKTDSATADGAKPDSVKSDSAPKP
jgi:hypothetical protein